MPVRARSRASSSTRNSPQWSSIARSSSSSASKPAAITPPSRTCAAGSAAIARVEQRRAHCGSTSSACAERRDQRRVGARERAARSPAGAPACRAARRGRAAAPTQRDARGDALDVGGARELLRDRDGAPRGRRPSAAIAACRAAAASCARSGCVSQCRSRRLPAGGGAGVEQREQRGRRLAAQRLGDLEVAPRRGVEREVLARALDGKRAHVRERRLLGRRGVGEQRAGGADGEVPVLGAERGEVARAEMLRERADAPPRHRTATPAARASARRRRACGDGAPSGTSSSATSSRSSAAAVSAAGTSASVNCPDARLSQAMPVRCLPGLTATSRLSRLASSRPASVSVPGVTTRSDLALDRALARRGVADLLADRDRFAELHQLREVASTAWYGTPAIGIGAPADCPRAVSVMSSRRAARSASS